VRSVIDRAFSKTTIRTEYVSGKTVDANRPILLHRRATKPARGDGQIVGKPLDHGTVQLKGAEGGAKQMIVGSCRQNRCVLVQFEEGTADKCADQEIAPVGKERTVRPAKAPLAAAQPD